MSHSRHDGVAAAAANDLGMATAKSYLRRQAGKDETAAKFLTRRRRP